VKDIGALVVSPASWFFCGRDDKRSIMEKRLSSSGGGRNRHDRRGELCFSQRNSRTFHAGMV
jgi:hypothetical protein